ncbi:MAG: hypothetical protein BGO01_12900 [Armatimonadetes bacterium 55-13]|nr:MAG: hypothetical protein ABT09_02485 [bacterium SCN 57-13]OJU61808.1 MAG: hypothetical protein BGO01_12900 [Armatimonadetes bacterium 55-13]
MPQGAAHHKAVASRAPSPEAGIRALILSLKAETHSTGHSSKPHLEASIIRPSPRPAPGSLPPANGDYPFRGSISVELSDYLLDLEFDEKFGYGY